MFAFHLAFPVTELDASRPGPIDRLGRGPDREMFGAVAARRASDPAIYRIWTPKRRMVGQPGEQSTMFIREPSGNGIEFKGFDDQAALFAH